MTKDKWINIRCTEQERQDITEQAKKHNMSVAEFFRYLVAKERKEMQTQKDIEKSFEESEKDFEDFVKRYGRVCTPQNDEVRE